MLVVCACAAPALASPPVVEPRRTKPDSVRALERAREDSLSALERAREDSLSALEPHLSAGMSLAVGLATTLGPPAIALLVNPPGSDNEWAWEGTLTAGLAVGLLVGPAIGLAGGGRGDLAKRGLLIRGLGYGATLLGVFAVARSFESSSGGAGGGAGVAILGLVGAGVSVVSAAYDLAITPSAVDRGRGHRVSVRPVVDERGRLAMRATF
jgi:hypothetical protein